LAVASQIGRHLKKFKVIVNKSTVPVGTAYRVQNCLQDELNKRGITDSLFEVISNPEFLKEGAAIKDFMHPDRIVIGLDEGPNYKTVHQKMELLYSSFNRHHARTIWMGVRSAELTKYAANAMLATRISFMNEIANLSDLLGADIDSIRRGIGADQRIGHDFLYAGTGYGGSCFPKDTKALARIGQEHAVPMQITETVIKVNEEIKRRMIDKIVDLCDGEVKGKTIGVLGVTFKPNTDDMREAPSLTIIPALVGAGAKVRVADPEGKREGEALLPGVRWVENAYQAAQGADAIVILTEWNEYRGLDLERLARKMGSARMADLRNVYDAATAKAAGFEHYVGVGR
jgi:UDPglucose 6-dehydrogenase